MNDNETKRLSLLQQEEHLLRTDGIRYLETMQDKPLFQRHEDKDVADGLYLFHTYEFRSSHSEKSWLLF